jgi:hypothetical protein
VYKLRYSRGEFARARIAIRAMGQFDTSRAHTKAFRRIAEAFANIIRRRYAEAHWGHHKLTLAAYEYPAKDKPLVHSPRSLQRTGVLARSVRIIKLRTGYRVDIDPDKVYGGEDPSSSKRGVKVRTIAQQMEAPKSFTVTVTPKMRKYLIALIEQSGGPGPSRGGGSLRVGATLYIRPTARPIWKPAYDKDARPLMNILLREIRSYAQKVTGSSTGILIRGRF